MYVMYRMWYVHTGRFVLFLKVKRPFLTFLTFKLLSESKCVPVRGTRVLYSTCLEVPVPTTLV
jgi:hypothetical protein